MTSAGHGISPLQELQGSLGARPFGTITRSTLPPYWTVDSPSDSLLRYTIQCKDEAWLQRPTSWLCGDRSTDFFVTTHSLINNSPHADLGEVRADVAQVRTEPRADRASSTIVSTCLGDSTSPYSLSLAWLLSLGSSSCPYFGTTQRARDIPTTFHSTTDPAAA